MWFLVEVVLGSMVENSAEYMLGLVKQITQQMRKDWILFIYFRPFL